MTTFAQFAARCKMRHDFADRIQVRYRHSDGQEFDTWVSGEEVLQRMRSSDVEATLRQLGDLSLEDLRALAEDLPAVGKEQLSRDLRERLARSVDETLGDSILAASLADLIDEDAAESDRHRSETEEQKQLWRAQLRDPRFKAVVLELAFIQLEGSLPEDDSTDPANDWVEL